VSRLDLVVGPNGAGKSTFVEFVLASARPGVPFVNADVIAAARWPEDPVSHAHEAAEAAQAARNALIASGDAFIAETVASHESKVDLVRGARDAGYYVHLVVVAVPEELAVERVRLRVAAGGHDVPEEKIRSRWQRLWDNVVVMIELANSVEVFDNAGSGPRTIATFVAGELVGAPRWPDWIPEPLAKRWPAPAGPR
jgi:predicted ABC-type ATPase